MMYNIEELTYLYYECIISWGLSRGDGVLYFN